MDASSVYDHSGAFALTPRFAHARARTQFRWPALTIHPALSLDQECVQRGELLRLWHASDAEDPGRDLQERAYRGWLQCLPGLLAVQGVRANSLLPV